MCCAESVCTHADNAHDDSKHVGMLSMLCCAVSMLCCVVLCCAVLHVTSQGVPERTLA